MSHIRYHNGWGPVLDQGLGSPNGTFDLDGYYDPVFSSYTWRAYDCENQPNTTPLCTSVTGTQRLPRTVDQPFVPLSMVKAVTWKDSPYLFGVDSTYDVLWFAPF